MDIQLFGLGSSRSQAQAIATGLGIAPSGHEEREFEDGEHKARPLVSVRGADVYVVHSLHAEPGQSPNDKLCRLLFFLATLRDHGAARVTAVVPYLGYARKDRRTKPHDPVASRYVAQLLEACGIDRVLALDVHNPAAFENAFRCEAAQLEARPMFVAHLEPAMRGRDVTVLSPDAGGVKRADALRQSLAQALDAPVELGLMEKQRSGGIVSGETLFAQVEGRSVVLVDDLIGTGTTLRRAARAARAVGAQSVIAVASHGLFVDHAVNVIADDALDQVVVTDSVPPFRLDPAARRDKLVVLDSAPLFAEAIRRIEGGGSITELVEV